MGRNPVVLVLNKADLLPRDFHPNRVKTWVYREAGRMNIWVVDVILVSAIMGYGVQTLEAPCPLYPNPRALHPSLACPRPNLAATCSHVRREWQCLCLPSAAVFFCVLWFVFTCLFWLAVARVLDVASTTAFPCVYFGLPLHLTSHP